MSKPSEPGFDHMALLYSNLSAVGTTALVQQAGMAIAMHQAMKSSIHVSYPFVPYFMGMALQYSNPVAAELPNLVPAAGLAITEHLVAKGEMLES